MKSGIKSVGPWTKSRLGRDSVLHTHPQALLSTDQFFWVCWVQSTRFHLVILENSEKLIGTAQYQVVPISLPSFTEFAECYVSITHVNSVSVSVYHVTICQWTLFRDTRQLTTILSLSLCSLRHSSKILRATLKSYLMSLLFSHHQWISTRTLYSSFQP